MYNGLGIHMNSGSLRSKLRSWKEGSTASGMLRQMVSTLDLHAQRQRLPNAGERASFLRHGSLKSLAPMYVSSRSQLQIFSTQMREKIRNQGRGVHRVQESGIPAHMTGEGNPRHYASCRLGEWAVFTGASREAPGKACLGGLLDRTPGASARVTGGQRGGQGVWGSISKGSQKMKQTPDSC